MREIRRREEPQALDQEEVGRLIARALAEGDEAMALLIRLLYESGARISEALALRPADIRLASMAAWAILPNLKRRRRPGEKHPVKRCVISSALAADLLSYATLQGIPDDGYVFRSPREPNVPLTRQYVWKRFQELAEAEGIRRIGRDGRLRPAWPHTLRHGCAQRLVLAGVAAPIIQQQLGHASLGTTQRYFDLSDDTRVRVLARIAETLISAGRPQADRPVTPNPHRPGR
jgi:integrase